ncbi:hypothetical protein QDX08_24280 (plasmid) [Escherichia coli]|uniref:hypothetical protein n=1 Tax=Escherichia coli TaxID=562 RepID=UPI0024AC8848|nr:hypothetical protein [Escherichia coli]WHF85234.1 hypothetical protein QDX08_24280 [Escherichia coli]
MAISKALEAINQVRLWGILSCSVRHLVLPEKVIDRYDVAVELQKAVKTDNWRPFFART